MAPRRRVTFVKALPSSVLFPLPCRAGVGEVRPSKPPALVLSALKWTKAESLLRGTRPRVPWIPGFRGPRAGLCCQPLVARGQGRLDTWPGSFSALTFPEASEGGPAGPVVPETGTERPSGAAGAQEAGPRSWEQVTHRPGLLGKEGASRTGGLPTVKPTRKFTQSRHPRCHLHSLLQPPALPQEHSGPY